MDERRRTRLQEAGIDVDGALERMMGSEALLERLLGKFLEDENYQKLCAALDEKRQEDAVAASHTLKGVCGNLSMPALFSLFTRQVEALRAGDWTAAAALMEEIRPAYARAREAISDYEQG